MPWYDAQALHIFAPPHEPYGANWVQQILGEVVRPVIAEYPEKVSWLWVTRYSGPYKEDAPPRGYPLPLNFCADGGYRFVVLRLHTPADTRAELQARIIQLAQRAGCFTEPEGWIPYDPIHDLGGDRFIRSDAEPPQRTERARLTALFVDATIRLMLHSLSQDEHGRWSTEPNMLPKENPKGSFFESVRHLFCNATGVPTTVLLGGNWSSLQVATYWMHPLVLAGQQLRPFDVEVAINY
jgi:hypothetical protein